MRSTILNSKTLNLTLIASAFALVMTASVHAQVLGGGGLGGNIGGGMAAPMTSAMGQVGGSARGAGNVAAPDLNRSGAQG
ncbi:MAG: hypothetical protein M3Y93_07690, partial [Pseudomonadota bacterium]|nr:hypothetical protein [Pseudomonadota bacterium]